MNDINKVVKCGINITLVILLYIYKFKSTSHFNNPQEAVFQPFFLCVVLLHLISHEVSMTYVM